MVGWHYQLSGHEFEQALGDGEGQEACHATVHGVAESDMSERINNSNNAEYIKINARMDE